MRIAGCTACWCQCVDLIKENNRWRYLPCLLENLAHSSFAFTYPFGKQLGSPDRDEVCPAFTCDCFCDQSFAGPRRTIEKNTPWGFNTEIFEFLPVGKRIFNRFANFCFCVFKPTNIFPFNMGYFEHHFPHSTWANIALGTAEVTGKNPQRIQDFRRDLLSIEIQIREIAAQCPDCCLTGKCCEIGAYKTVCLLGKSFNPHIFCKRHTTRMNLKNFNPVQLTRDANLNLPVKPSRPAKGGINCIYPVCRTNNDDLPSLLQTIHHGQELGNNPALHFTCYFLTPGCNGVKFVNKNNRRGVLPCLLKDFTEPLFAFPIIFRYDFGTLSLIHI